MEGFKHLGWRWFQIWCNDSPSIFPSLLLILKDPCVGENFSIHFCCALRWWFAFGSSVTEGVGMDWTRENWGGNLVGVDGFPFTSLQAVLGLGGQPSTCQVAPPHNGPLSWDISCGFFSVWWLLESTFACVEAFCWGNCHLKTDLGRIKQCFKRAWNREVAPGAVLFTSHPAGDAASLAETELHFLEVFSQFGKWKAVICNENVWECLRYLMRRYRKNILLPVVMANFPSS